MEPLAPDLVTGARQQRDHCPANLSGRHVYQLAKKRVRVGTREVLLPRLDAGAIVLVPATEYVYRWRDLERCRCGREQQLLGAPA